MRQINLIAMSCFSMFAILLYSQSAFADIGSIPLITAKQVGGVTNYSISIKIIALMTILSVLPAILITTTAFTRIIIVFAILRQAIGIPNVPSNQILIGLSLIMTLFVMTPIIGRINDQAVVPYSDGKIDERAALVKTEFELKNFMLKQIKKKDLNFFYHLAKMRYSENADHPLLIVLPAYITSELKTSFEIGFLIFIPFLIIDLVVASVLMSIGMMMLSPMIISLPFKILFFVLANGWGLLVSSLVTSFRVT